MNKKVLFSGLEMALIGACAILALSACGKQQTLPSDYPAPTTSTPDHAAAPNVNGREPGVPYSKGPTEPPHISQPPFPPPKY